MNSYLDAVDEYKYKGARAMIILQEQHLRSFLDTWKKAKENKIQLPRTEDKDYESLETLLVHILRASRGYIRWICDQLNLPDPGIEPTPKKGEIEQEADSYLEHLIERWRVPLKDVPEDLFMDKTYTSRWKVDYCIDAMLEHAVMHPIRHEFQLSNLIKAQGG
jgi:uncharacterized damage-inducible protein DinB